jgi:RAT1-interacting protein
LLDDSSIRYYYPPKLGADLSKGYDTFEKLDDTPDDHLDSLLKTIVAHEEKLGKCVAADIVTWRGMMTKVQIFKSSRQIANPDVQFMAAIFSDRDG